MAAYKKAAKTASRKALNTVRSISDRVDITKVFPKVEIERAAFELLQSKMARCTCCSQICQLVNPKVYATYTKRLSR